ncbi:hypothetical protein CYMTET_6983 [Cymbomonas tetramitiformis]|uniref:Uncharacterized protein n=1 Tax=Cymbomonas tetramitiformis TaxID=36881 RepID=A0AAE0GWH0_9CHLO|nr:hypothetical protein CYMTET_6983 [Cymbomonas tetramitiformis]
MVKLEEPSAIVADFYFLTVFLKRYSMLWETLMDAQREKHGENARKLKVFPLTRFAFAYLMVSTALYSWSILRDIPDWPEYAVVKLKATQTKRTAEAEFNRFEDLVGDMALKKKGVALNFVLEPLCNILHYVEGDSVPPSHLLPLYCLYFKQMGELPLAVTTQFRRETLDSIKQLVKDRWLGTSRKDIFGRKRYGCD